MSIRRIRSDGPWEEQYGYVRAVVAGDFVFVSGCTSTVDGEVRHEGDPYLQTVTAFRVAEKALAEVGLTLADVVQTRMYITHRRDADEVGRAHKDLFGQHPPTATMVVVKELVDYRMLVEVEAVAYRGERT
ncbi:endoribonuclease L-PSP [Carbonactinospora thermoautotrophica]|uniref:Endoribonuclease L-PSP n=1 Tax=Carbonactinospora thermoautotrophica TaxID=1469144 RepID=A0A132NDV0_9ACTN|nr:RidA family protein [Carbonactinospora thermoautotrophica]KWW99838.1 Endoribonuclease L-PSP [Carbonactinospora thermoautotrophica]KWX04438.1 endoribonuclease L-PSP [Carbonactinospora thermoautotrophica]KWX08274.1 endoribonuclease L-PSP [Carbonactinospora thermoautotrophica]